MLTRKRPSYTKTIGLEGRQPSNLVPYRCLTGNLPHISMHHFMDVLLLTTSEVELLVLAASASIGVRLLCRINTDFLLSTLPPPSTFINISHFTHSERSISTSNLTTTEHKQRPSKVLHNQESKHIATSRSETSEMCTSKPINTVCPRCKTTADYRIQVVSCGDQNCTTTRTQPTETFHSHSWCAPCVRAVNEPKGR